MDGSTGLGNGRASKIMPECDHCQIILLLGQFSPVCVATSCSISASLCWCNHISSLWHWVGKSRIEGSSLLLWWRWAVLKGSQYCKLNGLANREAMHRTGFRATRPSWDISKGDAAYVELLESLTDLEKSHKKQQIVSCLAEVTISNHFKLRFFFFFFSLSYKEQKISFRLLLQVFQEI